MNLPSLFSAPFLANAAVTTPMTLADYLALGGPSPTARFAYGSAPSQYVELFRPFGSGPFPVVVLVHGGCWSVQFGGMIQMRSVAGALCRAGIAVWNVEYRRVDEAGGGYPGTYLDINAALARLAALAPAQQLDTSRLVAVGHSAGGQLVQWLAGRGRIAPASLLFQATALPVREIISLGGLADLRAEQALIAANCARTLTELAGAPSASRPDVFSDTNAADLIPNGSRTVLITGEHDTVSPPRVAHAYAARARAGGDRAEVVILPGASHYDEIAASSAAWPVVFAAILRALDMPAPSGH